MRRLIPSPRRLAVCLSLCGLSLWGQSNPTFTPTSLPNGIVFAAYSQTFTASGGYGAGTYAFSLFSGTLPTGTTLSAGGVLSGTTLQATGTFNFTVQVASTLTGTNTRVTGTQSFTIVVYPTVGLTLEGANSGTVGVPYSQVFTAGGGAGAASYTWSLVSSPLPPGLTFSAGGVLSGTPTAAGTFPLTVQVSSLIPTLGAVTASATYYVSIYPPILAISTTVLADGVVGIPYSATIGATGGTPPYTWSVSTGTIPGGLSFDRVAATLSGTPGKTGIYTFSISVIDALQQFATSPFTITVVAPLVITTPAPLTAGLQGQAYSQGFAATGGTPPYRWSINAPPPGLAMNPATGALTGTPSATGTFSFNVTVADAASLGATGAFTVFFYPSLTVTLVTASPGALSVPYSQAFTASGAAGSSTYVWTLVSGTLPPGLTLSASGALSGTPTTLGTFVFTVRVASLIPNVGLATASQAFSIVIAPLAITGSLGGGVVGIPYSATLGAAGGRTPYTWSVSSGSIPGGLSLDKVNATLSGIPNTPGSFSLGITVTDAAGLQATASFTIKIVAQLLVTTTTPLAGGYKGLAYSQSFAATGGTPPYQWSIDTPPSGLSMDPSSGTLAGTPGATGTFNFNVTVADAASLVTAKAFTITITDAPKIVTTSLPGGTVGTAYSQQLSAAGGFPPYQWTVASGALPSGITLDGTSGALSGAPTAAGSFSFTIRLSDTRQSATAAFTIAVGVPPPPSVTISGLPDTPTPATQPLLGLSVGGAYPLAVQGTITLTFAPNSGPDDPSVQFTTGGRTATFQIPVGSTQAQFPGSAPGVQTGTDAGTITLTLKLTAGGVDITPTPAPTRVLRVIASAPVITSATVTPTSGGFTLVVVGYATTRDVASAAITFNAAAGVTLTGNTATVSLSQAFTTWYGGPTSAQYGSLFTLQIPFTVQNGTNPLASLSVVLTNSLGNSAAATATF